MGKLQFPAALLWCPLGETQRHSGHFEGKMFATVGKRTTIASFPVRTLVMIPAAMSRENKTYMFCGRGFYKAISFYHLPLLEETITTKMENRDITLLFLEPRR